MSLDVEKEIDKLVKKTRTSVLTQSGEQVTAFLATYMRNLQGYVDYDGNNAKEPFTSKEFIEKAIPGFQRESDKWSESMQVKFVENVMCKSKTVIKLFKVEGEGYNYQIIDGLQRSTAIIDFLEGRINAFGYSREQYGEKLGYFLTQITLELLEFENWEQVGQYYVAVNENITHSPEDIQKAKDWFKKEKGIIL